MALMYMSSQEAITRDGILSYKDAGHYPDVWVEATGLYPCLLWIYSSPAISLTYVFMTSRM